MRQKAWLDRVRCDPWRRTKVNLLNTCRNDLDGVETEWGDGLGMEAGANLRSAQPAPGIKAA